MYGFMCAFASVISMRLAVMHVVKAACQSPALLHPFQLWTWMTKYLPHSALISNMKVLRLKYLLAARKPAPRAWLLGPIKSLGMKRTWKPETACGVGGRVGRLCLCLHVLYMYTLVRTIAQKIAVHARLFVCVIKLYQTSREQRAAPRRFRKHRRHCGCESEGKTGKLVICPIPCLGFKNAHAHGASG